MCRLVKLLAAERALDTVVWQLLASVICPGYTIHTVVALAHAGLLPLEVGIHQGKLAVGRVSNLHTCFCVAAVWALSGMMHRPSP